MHRTTMHMDCDQRRRHLSIRFRQQHIDRQQCKLELRIPKLWYHSGGSSYNILIGNNANSNDYSFYEGAGIYLEYSSNNTLIGNNASNNGNSYDYYYNGIGISLYESSNNIINNNIFNNTNNVAFNNYNTNKWTINTWNTTKTAG